IYACKGTSVPSDAGSDASVTTYAWALKAPDARLYDDECSLAGTHFAGPTWQSSVDGSSVVGTKISAAPAPLAGAVPWLLLRATSNNGEGVFSNVTAVQRVDTD